MTLELDVVALTPDDWRRWRALRLAALDEAPAAFGSTLAQWSGAGDTAERWRGRLAAVPHNLVLVHGSTDVAMVSLTAPDEAGTPELISMWVSPGARGTGAADLAVRSVLAIAATAYAGLPVALSVYADNVAAVRLYARHGFVDAGVSPDDERERRMVRPPG